MHDLLTEPLIGVRTAKGDLKLNLPGTLAALLRGDVDDFTGLRAHQADPWHVMLVQLAASVMARQPEGMPPPVDEAFWHAGLLDLADGCASAWELAVEDLTKPAFMQHPLAKSTYFKDYEPNGPTATHPDKLDVLVTSKNHDLKASRATANDLASWLFALVTFQTTSGYLGSGNYGTARMNSGTGSRCIVSLVSEKSPSRRFSEELAVVRSMRTRALMSGLAFRDRGVVLTWLRPWPRDAAQYSLASQHSKPATLEPWFIEAVRLVRLQRSGNDLVAYSSTSAARQVGPKSFDSGDVCDPWSPINVSDTKKVRSSLTLSASGWSPERVSQLLFQQGFELTDLQRPRANQRTSGWFIASVLARSKKGTEGFHRVILPVPAKALLTLGVASEREQLAKFAETLRVDAAAAEATLRVALKMLALGGAEKSEGKKGKKGKKEDTSSRWVRDSIEAFTRRWRDHYFESLWLSAEKPSANIRRAWQTRLVDQARFVLRAAEQRLPSPVGRRWRARVVASDLLDRSLRKRGFFQSAADLPSGFTVNREGQ
jgi:CRISPR system Cascade subunit CasA